MTVKIVLAALGLLVAGRASALQPLEEFLRGEEVEIAVRERIDRYMGTKPATATTNGDFTIYQFDPKSPARCIEGTPFYVSVRKGKSKNVMLYESPSGSTCECCHPSLTAAGNREGANSQRCFCQEPVGRKPTSGRRFSIAVSFSRSRLNI